MNVRWSAVAVLITMISAPVMAMEYIPPVINIPSQGNKVVVNIPQNRVFLYQDGNYVGSWKAAPGKPSTPTPTGKWRIGQIKDNPVWYIPASIQAEYNAKGIKHKGFVKPGPNNPLGPVFIRMGQTSIGLHGTNKPSSVPGFPSHGCVRMKSEEAVELSEGLNVGDEAEIVYQPILTNIDEQGNLWLSVTKDVYKKGIAYTVDTVFAMIDKIPTDTDVTIEFDEELIKQALSAKDGKPVQIGKIS